jgi:hypothetical protein
VCLLGLGAAAEIDTKIPSARSRSGQFTVYGDRFTSPSLGNVAQSSNRKQILLEIDPLAVSCERVKAALLLRLGVSDQWRGKIAVRIRPARRNVPAVVVTSNRYSDGWIYGVDVAEEVEPEEVLRGLVRVLLLEIANRYPGPCIVELPFWLVEGIARDLLTVEGADLILQKNPLVGKVGQSWGQLQSSARSRLLVEQTLELRKLLVAFPALTFDELCLPSERHLSEQGLPHYRASAHLLVKELLRLPQGQQTIWNMLSLLPQALNWQTAFLRAYFTRFPTLLDAEKWWALSVVHFTGRDGAYAWSIPRTLERLGDALQIPVEVRRSPNEATQRSSVSLEEVLRSWGPSPQRTALLGILSRLRAVGSSAAKQAYPVVQGYQNLLAGYLHRRERVPRRNEAKGMVSAEASVLLRDTLTRLRELEQAQARLQAAASAPITTPPRRGNTTTR